MYVEQEIITGKTVLLFQTLALLVEPSHMKFIRKDFDSYTLPEFYASDFPWLYNCKSKFYIVLRI